MFKSHTCGELRSTHIGQTVTLAGWVHAHRDHGGVLFFDMRDRSGIVQVVSSGHGEVETTARKLRGEWCIAVRGMVRKRPEGTENPKLDTGEVEVVYRARDFLGDYVMHCHNTTHEDYAMLLRWDSMNGLTLADAPMPTFDGVFFERSFALPTAETGDGVGPDRGIPVP